MIDPVESWQLSDGEIGLATFLMHHDYRDYFDRLGQTASVSVSDNDVATLTLSYAYDHLTSRKTGAPFTLFDNTGSWRPNPILDDGAFQIFDAAFHLRHPRQRTRPLDRLVCVRRHRGRRRAGDLLRAADRRNHRRRRVTVR